MKLLDLTLPSPAENLACDEALLDWCEDSAMDEVLRFWESVTPFVVVGYANKVAREVNVAACGARGIPILRRCSGGGAVVQGPGCLSYALVLRILEDGPTRSINATNQFIMERNRAAMEALLARSSRREEAQISTTTSRKRSENLLTSAATDLDGDFRVGVQGHTDLTLDGLKFSGNSQRRRRQFLLFHGTLLLNFNLQLIGELLPMPSLQPDYRQRRDHGEFLANLNLPAGQVKAALQIAWAATGILPTLRQDAIGALVEGKYSTAAWNFKC